MNWNRFREETLEKYRKAEIDRWIKPITDDINSADCFVTLSSCAGRFAVMDMPEFGDKRNSVFLGKWHDVPAVEDVLTAIRKGVMETWFMLHPPILHVSCKDLESARILLDILRKAGFRRAGIISLKRMVVEIAGQERIEFIAARNGQVFTDAGVLRENYLEAVKKLEMGRKRFEKFHSIFREVFL
ncbi:tRNA-wybutosine modification methyltransferase TYW3 [Geoglobus acetivorans]|uniref:tRNA(Phe) 7-((3-amino-3-carboxypropyl)-4-demethylwyosine(37)-N(4))-methyltransferase n=1 Tax=Geoglobus acetivorans TaxID=565033 RepID=A0A0A7GBK5_GEOAI|nr:tRNA methylase [Geoglobus acetivorans]